VLMGEAPLCMTQKMCHTAVSVDIRCVDVRLNIICHGMQPLGQVHASSISDSVSLWAVTSSCEVYFA